ncbi:IPT/TIG domain-containing protein [uncultured Chitinophaga sp.]|uniref:IPT/TIG domain-containing protein n=1 Tax=uncultured Chitinophaga sp. TaxID=339340 RepID=UPI0025F1F62F|nr:IPT/TIG domain-containing protein [uncultured Chitinophaga sp.]
MRKIITSLLMVCAIACKKDDKPRNEQPVLVPEITSFTPDHGLPDAEVTITGKNFSTKENGNRVTFNTTVANVITYSATQLKVKVPAGATTGKLKVTVGQQTGTSATDFTVDIPGPKLTGFAPLTGPYGTVVTITGTGFGNDPVVKVDNRTMPLVSHSDTEIKFKTPSFTNINTYKIFVQVDNSVLQSAESFTVSSAGPVAEWIEKTINAAPAAIFINGSSFAYNNKLYWGFTKLTINETKAGFMTCDPRSANPQWVFDFLPDGMLGPEQTNATASVFNNKVYIGSALANDVTGKWWRYNPDNNTAETLPDLPTATTFSLSFVLNSTLYTGFGGVNKKLYKFNTAGNGAWDEALTGDFREISHANAVVIGDNAYIGRALMDLNGFRQAMFRFTAPNLFVRVTDMPEQLVGLSTPAFALNGKAYFVVSTKVWEYTPDANGGTWRVALDKPGATVISFVQVVDGVPYGWTGSGRLFEFRFKP